MKTNRKNAAKVSYALLFIMLLFSFVLPGGAKVYAAGGPEPAKPCSVTFDIPTAYREALKDTTLPVRLFKVADITESGRYKDIKGYEELKFNDLAPDITAGELKTAAEKVAAFLNQTVWKTTPDVPPDYSIDIVNNRGTQIDMASGLYLVCVKPTTVGNVTYSALPYLISLPTLIETKGANGEKELNWIYDLTVDLKLASAENPTKPTEPSSRVSPDEPTDPTTYPSQTTQPAQTPTYPAASTTEPPIHGSGGGISAKTGDDSNIPLAIALMVISGAVAIFSGIHIVSKRKEKNS